MSPRTWSPTTVFPPGSVRAPQAVELFARIQDGHVIYSLEGPADLYPVLEAGRIVWTLDPVGATPLRIIRQGSGPIRFMETT